VDNFAICMGGFQLEQKVIHTVCAQPVDNIGGYPQAKFCIRLRTFCPQVIHRLSTGC